jgi:predicted ABC-type transport system involved in lysophospholipase L1 biosynthesis ATPase subunit
MHLALDLDGTISAAPSIFAAMGASLIDNGHTVTVLTGALHDFPDSAKTVDGRLNQLRNLGLQPQLHFTDVHICIGVSGGEVAQLKRAYCKETNVDLLIDDEPTYCNAVAEVTHVAQFRRPS